MRRGRILAAAIAVGLIASIAIAPTSAVADQACMGGTVDIEDGTGDVNPASGVGATQSPPDLRVFRIGYVADGLDIAWDLERDPSLQPGMRMRWFAFGHVEERFSPGSIPYAFVEAARNLDGDFAWRYGTGQHFPFDTANQAETAQRWRDTNIASLPTPGSATTVTITIPQRWLNHHFVGGGLTYSTVTAEYSGDEIENIYHGRPTSPIGGVAIGRTDLDLWELTDHAPNGRIQGTWGLGYQMTIAGDDVADELCRPPSDVTNDPSSSCSADVTNVSGPKWLAWRITGSQIDGSLALSATTDGTVSPGVAMVSDQGSIGGLAGQPPSRRSAASVSAHSSEVRGPGMSQGNAQTNITIAYETADFSPSSSWLLTVLLPAGVSTADLTFSLNGRGLTCYGPSSGDAVWSVRPESFSQGAGLQAEHAGPGIVAEAGGRVELEAQGHLLTLFGGHGSLGTVESLWMLRPNGERMSAGATGVAPSRLDHLFLGDLGPPGRYMFGIDYALWASVAQFPILLAADIS